MSSSIIVPIRLMSKLLLDLGVDEVNKLRPFRLKTSAGMFKVHFCINTVDDQEFGEVANPFAHAGIYNNDYKETFELIISGMKSDEMSGAPIYKLPEDAILTQSNNDFSNNEQYLSFQLYIPLNLDDVSMTAIALKR